MKRQSFWTPLFILAILFSALSAPAAELGCQYLEAIEDGFLDQHVRYSQRDRKLEAKTVDQYIKKLDSSKLYLLSGDVKKIKTLMRGLFFKIKKKNCAPIKKVQELYVKRVKDRVKFAKKFLGPKYKFNPKTEILFDSDKRKYSKSLKEANAFHSKYLHFQISNYLATDVKLAEAKKKVIKNYERLLKRVLEMKEDDIYANYLDGFARALDPHSSFFSRDTLEDFEISMRLSLEGIGATLSSQDGFTVIEQLIPGGAAARSHLLKSKDKIVAVAQDKGKFEDVIEMDLRNVVRRIRGKKGTKVRLRILREVAGKKKSLVVSLVRDKIKLEDDAAAIHYFDKTINGKKAKLGLINLPSFYADSRRGGRSSARDLKKLLAEAKKKNVSGVVLDLSNNGGGSLEDAVKIAGLFFKTGNVVKQSGRNAKRSAIELKDVDPKVDYNGPLVVLTSRLSASASEIVAGALKDYKRAVILGNDHTFGKGSVQSVVAIPQKLGAIKVTVGMFYIPGGNSTQHMGVQSDISIPGLFTTDEIGEKTLDYSLPPQKIKKFVSREAYVKQGTSVWHQVDSKTIKKLKKLSKERVAKSKDFKKIKEDLKKSLEKKKVVKIGDILDDKKEDKKKDKDKDRILSKKEKLKKYFERADIQESLNVLTDLVTIGRKVQVAQKQSKVSQ